MLQRALVIVLAGWSLGASAAQIVFDFSKDAVGKLPPGFVSEVSGTGEPGDWAVVDEHVPPLMAPIESNAAVELTQRAVVRVKSLNLDETHFPLLLYTNEILSDFTFSTRFKIAGGVVEPAAGIVFRAEDESNYYVLRASTEGNLLWYKVVNGKGHPEVGVGVRTPLAKDVWHELRVDCSGNQIRCFLDDKLAIPPVQPGAPTDGVALNDTTFTHGKIGFWSKADTKAFFVDAVVHYMPRVPYVQVVINNMVRQHPTLLGLKVYVQKGPGFPVVVASMNDHDVGQVGTKTEADVLDRASIYYLKQEKAVEITMPLRDRNGDVSAALKITMKSFRGETENTAVTRATLLKKELEIQIATMQDING